jgi:hypothetical protein
MKITTSFFLILFLLLSGISHANDFDCSKYEGTLWLGTITNPTEIDLRVQVFNNERFNKQDLIGLPPPYFDVVIKPGETKNINYKCGENSIIFIDEKTNSFRSLDFHVPNSFLNGKTNIFKYKLEIKRKI